jgi:signal transduction histidine kinase
MPAANPCVFVVDDDRSIRDSLSDFLFSAGLNVRTFASAQEFLSSRRPNAPSCLVLDVQLPGLSGLDLQQELAKVNCRIPIIFITGHGDIPMTVRAMKAGAIEFLTKPCRDDDLLHAVEQAIHRSRQLAPGTNPPVDEHSDAATEFSGMRKDSGEFPLELSLSTWATAHSHYVTGIICDLTAQKQLQETTRQQRLQLIQANKMTALGTLVSGVAHEINNPNQVVVMNAGVLAKAWDDAVGILDTYARDNDTFTLGGLPYTEMRATIPALLRDVHDGARRIERIIDDLKDFARPRGRGVPTIVSMNDAVQRALRLLAHLIKQHTDHLHVALAAEGPAVWGDAQHLEQIVVNLLTNALEALPDRRHGVTVTTAVDPAARAVRLEVRDDGVGIPPEHLARVCDPFFTTKEASGGTGLGLAITASLVRLHGGRLSLASTPGQGTSAQVTFPCPDAAEPPAQTVPPGRQEPLRP